MLIMKRSAAVLLTALMLVLSALPAFAAGPVLVDRIVLDREEACLSVGRTLMLSVNVTPGSAGNKKLSWSTSDESIATVTNGKVTAVSVGTAVITAASTDGSGVSGEMRVFVVKPVEKITLDDEKVFLPPGAVWEEMAYVFPADATVKDVLWASTNPKVAQVDSKGTITAVAPGKCYITCTAGDDSRVRTSVMVLVKQHEIVINEPGEFEVDFEMPEEEDTKTITQDGKAKKVKYKLTMHTDNGVVEKVSETSLRPVKAGSDTIHVVEIQAGKTIRDYKHTVFVSQSAMREEGSVPQDTGSGLMFRDIPWGSNYKEVKAMLSGRGERLKAPVARNGLIWTQIEGEVTFGHFKAFRNGLSFISLSANTENITANLQKTSFCMGDYYFSTDIPFDSLKQNVINTYDLKDVEPVSSAGECVWTVGDVTVTLQSKPKYIQLKITRDEQAD